MRATASDHALDVGQIRRRRRHADRLRPGMPELDSIQ
jgi:hypothetical protein